MLMKKILSIDRETGELIGERIAGKVDMSEDRFYQPFVDLYKEDMERLADQIRNGGSA